MKVICIDADKLPPVMLIEGNIYTVQECVYFEGEECYIISEHITDYRGVNICFDKKHFIPLSQIDETELLHARQTELA